MQTIEYSGSTPASGAAKTSKVLPVGGASLQADRGRLVGHEDLGEFGGRVGRVEDDVVVGADVLQGRLKEFLLFLAGNVGGVDAAIWRTSPPPL
jgi:hypothetical protein